VLKAPIVARQLFSSLLANALVNTAWRNGPVEKILMTTPSAWTPTEVTREVRLPV
jgi:hypothetical protein